MTDLFGVLCNRGEVKDLIAKDLTPDHVTSTKYELMNELRMEVLSLLIHSSSLTN